MRATDNLGRSIDDVTATRIEVNLVSPIRKSPRVARLAQGYARLRVSVKEDSGEYMLCKVGKVRR